MSDQLHLPELCSYCTNDALIPGIVFPIATNGRTDRAYVERCDECCLFTYDESAARALSGHLGKPALECETGVFIEGITFEEAQALKPQRYQLP